MSAGYILCFGFTVRGNGRKKNLLALAEDVILFLLEAVIERDRDVSPGISCLWDCPPTVRRESTLGGRAE
jgi:hypothetical protein